MNPTKETSSLSYLNATGQIPYGMTNDYMFRLILEKDNYILKGLICSLLSLVPEDIISVEIQNPILLNETVDDKEFILDIKILMNDSAIINLEMQMSYMLNWRERSLSYLCRVFDQLSHGQLYDDVKPAIHIGFLNFNPNSDEKPEFYASYKLLNEKTHAAYSDKFILRVVNLKQIDSATDEDRANRVDYWARLFTATTWEEIKMLAQNNDFIASASQMNLMRMSLQEKNAVPVRIICVWNVHSLNKRIDLPHRKLPLPKKTNSLGDSKNSLLKCNQQINIMASESHHINSDGIYLWHKR